MTGLILTLDAGQVEVITERAAALVLERLHGSTPDSGWPEWLDVKTAARYLGCEVGAVRKLYERRKVPHYQEGNGCKVWLRRSEIDAYMEGQGG